MWTIIFRPTSCKNTSQWIFPYVTQVSLFFPAFAKRALCLVSQFPSTRFYVSVTGTQCYFFYYYVYNFHSGIFVLWSTFSHFVNKSVLTSEKNHKGCGREEAGSTDRISLESSYYFIRKHFYYRIENHYFMILSFCILRWVDIQCGQQASSQINCRSLQAVECSKLPLQWEEFQEPLDVFGNGKEELLQSGDRSPSEFKDWIQGKIVTQYSRSQKKKKIK